MLKRLAVLLAMLAPGAPGAVRAESAASGLLYERTLMGAAGVRCGLFTPQVLDALATAREQARGAALRAGDSPAAAAATQARALQRAGAVDCRSAGLQTAAGRVREAYASYARLMQMRFPGPRSAWLALRPAPGVKGPRWAVVQALPGSGGWLLFGVADGRPALLDARRGAGPAASARLLLRDPGRLDRPFLQGPPPPSVSSAVLAAARSPAARTLWPAGATGATLYLFPQDLLGRLERLDPREVAAVELIYPAAGRDRVVAASLEIGDLRAAAAFAGVR
jgi:hypothetical protein